VTVLNRLGQCLARSHEDEARALFAECLSLCQRTGDRLGCAAPLMGLGNLALRRGDLAEARASYEEALALRREAGGIWAIANSVSSLADVARAEGDHHRAAGLIEEALTLWWRAGDRRGAAQAVAELAEVAAASAEPATAHYLASVATTLWSSTGDAPPPSLRARTLATHGEGMSASRNDGRRAEIAQRGRGGVPQVADGSGAPTGSQPPALVDAVTVALVAAGMLQRKTAVQRTPG
jgi:tetratricopeptide (TPR) repeat protein